MQLYLIRHAQSENNALYERGGDPIERNMDPELTELGRRQAVILARHLAQDGSSEYLPVDEHNRLGYSLTHLYASLMVRAVATGVEIARAVSLPLIGWVDWHEGGGIYLEDPETGKLISYPGKNRGYFCEHYPELIWPNRSGDGGWWNQPFEERPQRWERARRVLDDLLAIHGNSDDRVAVVMHGGFYNYFLKTLLGIGPNADIWFVMNNAAITRIDFTEGETRLIYQNRLDHLPTGLITFG